MKLPCLLTLLLIFVLPGYARGNGAPAILTAADLTPYSEWQKNEDERLESIRKNPGEIFIKIKPYHFRFRSNLRVNPALLEHGKKLMSIVLETSNKELVFEDLGGIPTSRLNYIIRITSGDGKIDGIFEDRKDILSTADELAKGPDKAQFIFQHAFDLPPGQYRIGAIARWGDGIYDFGISERSLTTLLR